MGTEFVGHRLFVIPSFVPLSRRPIYLESLPSDPEELFN